MNTTIRENIKAALEYTYNKILDDTFPQPEFTTILCSAEELEMAKQNGWIDDEGHFTDKAYDDFEKGVDKQLAKWYQHVEGRMMQPFPDNMNHGKDFPRSWTPEQRRARDEHRVKVFYVMYDFFASIFDTWENWDLFALGSFRESLTGCKVIDCFHSDERRSFGFVVCHPDFPIHPEGQQLTVIPNSHGHIFLKRISEVFKSTVGSQVTWNEPTPGQVIDDILRTLPDDILRTLPEAEKYIGLDGGIK